MFTIRCSPCRFSQRRVALAHETIANFEGNGDCDYRFRRPALAPTQRIRLLEQHLRNAVSFLQELDKQLPVETKVEVKAVLDQLSFWSYGKCAADPALTVRGCPTPSPHGSI